MQNSVKRAKKQLLVLLVIFGAFSSLYYFTWWLEHERIYQPVLLLLLIITVIFCAVQVFFHWYIFLHIKRPEFVETLPGLAVDVYIPTYNEPIWLVERSLSAALAMRYPHETYLIDDGHKAEYRQLAERLGAIYLSRPGNEDYKAGNVNNALAYSSGEFIAIFDVDHAPAEDFLDRALGHFRNENVGFVQVMLSHYNQEESFVGAAAAKRNDGFFGPSMLGLHGCDCVQAFGSNCIFRRKALDSIGGYKSGLAEDLNTSIHLHAKGWRSVYVPEALAKGLEPVDLGSFFKQQFKWSRGVFTILWGIYPRLANHLSLNKNICYLWRLTCFLAGPAVATHILFTILVLFQGSEIATNYFSDYLKHWAPFVIMYSCITFFVDKNYSIVPASPGFPFGGLLLAYGTWPVYTLSFLYSLFGLKVPFIATPKEAQVGNFLKLIIPQIITVVLLISASVWRLFQGMDFSSIVIVAFALLQILMHSGIFYAVYEGLAFETRNLSHKS
ncbi:MAG: cellulose synthase catalytic subunit [Candidatus Brocadiaceae bacterium]|nr:cellulose synthase catalytic subunit [Candidatus Brocadiaceae bacterium]